MGASDTGAFTVKAGMNSVDKAGNALAAAYTHATTLALDTTAPAAPSALALASGTTSPGNDATPEIEVTVGETGGEVTLYGDAACTTAASAATDVTDTSSPYKVTVDATALATDGSVTFRARHADAAGNASACSTASVAYAYDGTDPGITFPSGVTPTTGAAATIALADAHSKIKKYGAIAVDGTTGAATDCDTATEIGAGNLTTLDAPLASVNYSYTPPADSAGKKVCVYAEDAAGNSDSSLWGTAIAATATGPSVTAIAVTSSPPASPGGWYKSGNAIKVEVTFDGIIVVTGMPELKIRVGSGSGSEKTATCARKGATGDGRKKLACSYTVASGDEDTDGVSVERNKLSLPSGAAIKDGSDNAATLTYAAALALGARSGHKVDAKAPSLSLDAPVPSGPAQSKSIAVTRSDSGVGFAPAATTGGNYWFVDASTACDRASFVVNKSDAGSYFPGTAIMVGSEARNGRHLCVYTSDRLANVAFAKSAEITGIDTTDPGIEFPSDATPTEGADGDHRAERRGREDQEVRRDRGGRHHGRGDGLRHGDGGRCSAT